MNYDDWLVSPILDRLEENDAFLEWCENQDIDPDSQEAADSYDCWIEAMEEEAIEMAYDRYLDSISDKY